MKVKWWYRNSDGTGTVVTEYGSFSSGRKWAAPNADYRIAWLNNPYRETMAQLLASFKASQMARFLVAEKERELIEKYKHLPMEELSALFSDVYQNNHMSEVNPCDHVWTTFTNMGSKRCDLCNKWQDLEFNGGEAK